MQKEEALMEGLKEKINYWKLLIPMISDFISSQMSIIALIYLPGSIFDMLYGLQLVFVAFASRIFLKTAVLRNQWLGVFVIFMGVTIVGLADVLFDNDDDKSFN